MNRLKGFTLIELLIVVAIIGILAAIAVPNFLNAQVRAKVARAESEIRSLKNSLEAFFIDNNQYMPMSTDRTILNKQYRGIDKDAAAGGAVINIAHIAIGNARTGRRLYLTTPVAYISSIPFDPFRGDGSDGGYGYGSDGQSYYILTSYGPDSQDGLGIKGGELDEMNYTGARVSDYRRAGVRDSKFVLADLKYDPSNGTSSGGDVLAPGP
jgi:prepilin-type N-terminal cleavage/methylation domain-containing protein